MDKETMNKILEVRDAMRQNERYRDLCIEHELLNARFLKAVETLTQDQKNAVS